MGIVVGEISAEIRADTSRFSGDLSRARQQGDRFSSGLLGNNSRLSGSFNNLGSVISTSFAGINTIASNAGMALKNIGDSLTKYVTLPLAAAGVAVFKLGKDFEKELSKVTGLVGVSADQVDAWGKEILDLAPAIAKPPKELAEALFFVTSAGIKGAEAMEVLEMAGKASAAGLGETKVVADLVTSAMNAYGKENLSAGKATNILVAAVREGKAEASELAASMGQVLPLASNMGVTFDQVAAAQAAMTRTGTPAAEAATQLKSILAGLIKPSKQAEEQLQAMGTSSQEMRKKIKDEGLINALFDLKEMTGKFGEEAMARVFPNIRALMGTLDLMGSSAEDNAKIFDRISGDTNALNDAFKAAAETTDFKWNQALSKLQSVAIGFFDVLKSAALPILDKLIGLLDFVSNAFEAMSPGMQKAMLIMAAGLAALGPILSIAGAAVLGLTAVIGGLVTTITSIMTISAAVTAFGGLGAVLAAVGTAIGGFISAALPIIAIVGTIAAVAGSLIGLVLTSEKVRNGIKDKFDSIVNKVKEVAGFIKDHINEIKGAFGGLIKGITTGNFDSFIIFMQNLVPKETTAKIMKLVASFSSFRDKMISIRDTIIKIFAPVGDILMKTFSNLDFGPVKESFSQIGATIGPLLTALKSIGIVIGAVLVGAFGILLGVINGIAAAIPNSIAVVTSLVAAVVNVFNIIVGIFTGNADLITESCLNLWENVKSIFVNAIMFVVNLVKGLVTGIIDFFKNLYDTLVGHSIIPDMIKGIIDWFKSLPGKLYEIVSNLVSKVVNFFIKLKDGIQNVFNATKTFMVTAWNTIKSLVINIASALISFVINRFNTFRSNVSNIFNALRNSLSNIWNTIKSTVSSAVSNIVSTVKNKFSSLASSAYNSGKSIVDGIKRGISAAAGGAVSAMKNLVAKIRNLLPFSPAKEGPLSDLDKLNFSDSIIKSLNKARLKTSIPAFELGAGIRDNLIQEIGNIDITGKGVGGGTNFNGPMNFYGIEDMYSFMNEMRSLIQKHTGKVF